VIDGDLQHDETLLPGMLETLRSGRYDIVIGSRYVAGGGIAEWDEMRSEISRFATWLSRVVLRSDITDPMSGFFMIRRDAFEATVRRLSGIGFKLLLDLMVSAPRPLRFKELPYQFRARHAGRSKLDNQAAWAYTMLLLDKLIGNVVPVRFISFGLIGSFGVLLHLLIVYVLFELSAVPFAQAQATATALVLVNNYALNNVLTYRDKRRRGWGWWRGLGTFALACGIGAIANVGIASYLFQQGHAGWLTAAIAGILVGSLWNYVMTARTLWRVQRVN
jgi:dolichol-phosphate mannosyltransferase